MEHHSIERSKFEDVEPAYFFFTSETKTSDIPKETLTHLRVDSSVREIPERTFEKCCALVQVQLPDSLTRIGKYAFVLCSKLKCVQFVSRNGSLATFTNNGNSEDGLISFPEMKLQVDDFAFSFCDSLRKLVVCSVATRLSGISFNFCSGLISVEFPEGLQVIERWLAHCESLTTVKIPSSVIKIGEKAFYRCRSIASLDLPHRLLEIGKSSFEQCSSLEAIRVPSTVSSIGARAFKSCSNLERTTLPQTLKRIESETFCGCCCLESIEIPPTTSFIGDRAFDTCCTLSHIRLPPSVSSIATGAFSGCRGLISIEIPEEFPFELELLGCFSVKNLAGSLPFEFPWLASFLGINIARVTKGEADLLFKLRHRFDKSPLNKLCYYQSYHSSEDAMVQLRSLMEDDPLAATTQVDEFGMTPLHVLSLSQTPNLDMLLAVMKRGHLDHIIYGKDALGSTPMDNLCLNRMPDSKDVIRSVLKSRFSYLLDFDRSSKSEMVEAVDGAVVLDPSFRRREVCIVYFELLNHERKEILCLVELCLWKMKIDEATSNMEQILADRQACRIMSGAAVVIPHLLPFLGQVDVEDYFARYRSLLGFG
eukprot:scaffold1170_cov122-Cylindrotheca_fusiformis.AAC.4